MADNEPASHGQVKFYRKITVNMLLWSLLLSSNVIYIIMFYIVLKMRLKYKYNNSENHEAGDSTHSRISYSETK